MGDWLRGVCSFHFSCKDGQLDWHIGWLWVVLIATFVWWVLS